MAEIGSCAAALTVTLAETDQNSAIRPSGGKEGDGLRVLDKGKTRKRKG